MDETELQNLCERGQIELMETHYLDAATTLARAEQIAWDSHSFDTLARLYLPLQEARRQIRQRCGEGAVRMHLYPLNPNQTFQPEQILRETAHGQLLIAGWSSIAPAVQIRKLARERHLYVETFLARVCPVNHQSSVVQIVPVEDWNQDCLTLLPDELPPDAPAGNSQTYASVMALWERLHTPFLNTAKSEPDPIRRMQAYRFTLRVDPACELAHQFLAEIARDLARR